MKLPEIPILRLGEEYRSLEKTEVRHAFTGEVLALVDQANGGIIRRDLRRAGDARRALRALSCEELFDVCAAAADLFSRGDVRISDAGDLQSAEEFVELLSASTGLPRALCRRNVGKIDHVLRNLRAILRGLTRGMDPTLLDEGMGEQSGVPVSFFAVTDSLGAVLPSNSPGVNSLWLPAVPLKVPLFLKPGREDPWTPYRLVRALIDAGCPADAFSFYPTDHEGSSAVIDGCGRVLLFGDQSTVERHAADPRVQVHGPGHSKVLIGEDRIESWREYIDVIASSVADNGGRSCINASMVIVPRCGREIAEALARKLAEKTPRDPEDPEACLAGFADPRVAERIDEALSEGLQTAGAEDVSARFRDGERRVRRGGSTYLLPAVIYCESPDHPLARREFLFPYCSVIEVEPERMLEAMGESLVVTAITEDRSLILRLLDSPRISRLNLGPLPTSHVEWDQPHEGNLFEFLYRRRSIQTAAG